MFGAPEWVGRNVAVLLAIGFIPAMVFSWLYELTPDELKYVDLRRQGKPCMRMLLLAFALLPAVPASAQKTDPHLRVVDALVEARAGKDAPGIAVLVMHAGKVVHLRGYGYADVDREIPVDGDTLFDLASVSKQMTALAAALLIVDGTWTEDRAVAKILPDFASDGVERAITVGDLIHHVAALPDYLGDDAPEFTETTTNADVVDWLAEQPLTCAPGERYEYSNSAYLLLASAVAAAAGAKDLASFLHQRVWEPLGMRSTSIALPAPGVPRRRMSRGYRGDDGEFEVSESPGLVQGDGSVLTSLRDLSRYEAALAGQTLLGRRTSMLFRNGRFDNGEPIDDGDGNGYGFGWLLGTWQGERYASHSGSWMGTATYYQRNLDSGVSVVVLANGEDLDTEELAGKIEAVL